MSITASFPTKDQTSELIRKAQYCKNRMVERSLNLEHEDVYKKLTGMAKPNAVSSYEHLHLYKKFVDLVATAVTHVDPKMADVHLGDAFKWFEARFDGANFRN